jgi:arabinose-5-phosphate isomerase
MATDLTFRLKYIRYFCGHMQAREILESAERTIRLEAEALTGLIPTLDAHFVDAVRKVHQSKGRLVVTGIGKSAIVGSKIVATLNSTGTPALFMHAADAIHGDLGMIQGDDVVMIISKSGESPEIRVLIPLIRNLGNPIIAVVGNTASLLAREADFVLNTSVSQEACPNNLAPTSSTTAQMVMGDALAVCLMEINGFSAADFAKFHPGGALGKKLYLQVQDLSKQNECPTVQPDSSVRDVILEITRNRLGCTAVIAPDRKILGIITDGDLRRMLEKDIPWNEYRAGDIMHPHPKVINHDALAVNALDLMRKNNITQLIVTEQDTYMGIIHLHDLVREGLI